MHAAATELDATRTARLMQIDETTLRRQAATNGCTIGELCGGMGFVRFDLPPGHACFGQAFPCGCHAANDQE